MLSSGEGKRRGEGRAALCPRRGCVVELLLPRLRCPAPGCTRYSEMYDEDSLREARIRNRLVQDGGADARLEALYGDSALGENGADGTQSAAIAAAGIMAWEEGAEEAARIIGAEVSCPLLLFSSVPRPLDR